MNKAFVKESEDETAPKCPACLAIGDPVGQTTLATQLPPQSYAHLSSSVCYCPNPTCDVGYFDANRQTVPATLLKHPIHPKPAAAPLCLCLNISVADVIADARRKDPTRVRQILAHCKANPSACAKLTPHAKSCTAEAQQLYLKNLPR